MHKLVAGRPRDLADVGGIVMRQREELDVERVRTWVAGFAELVEDPDLGRPFRGPLRRLFIAATARQNADTARERHRGPADTGIARER